jgi:predicted PurR-regulated permease PerM
LFKPAAPFADQRDTTLADSLQRTGVLGDTTLLSLEDLDARLEARTTFLGDSLRRAMQRNVAEASRRAREEILSSGVVAGPREPTRSEMLQRRLSSGLAGSSRQLFSLVTGTIAAVGGLVLVMFLAIYIGAEPMVYRNWLLAVVPAEHRAHVRVVMDEMSKVLRKWLVTQLIAMIVIGVLSTVALLILDVRAPFALGLIAGLLEFVPTVGPVLAAIPAIAMGFIDSPQKALLVLMAYSAIQFVENNLLIPALMRGEIDLPPAITLIAQALMAVLFGFLGLMVAVPLTAAVLVPIRMMAARQDARERAMVRSAHDGEVVA